MPLCCLRMGSLVMRMARPQRTKNLLQKRLGKEVNGIYVYVVSDHICKESYAHGSLTVFGIAGRDRHVVSQDVTGISSTLSNTYSSQKNGCRWQSNKAPG